MQKTKMIKIFTSALLLVFLGSEGNASKPFGYVPLKPESKKDIQIVQNHEEEERIKRENRERADVERQEFLRGLIISALDYTEQNKIRDYIVGRHADPQRVFSQIQKDYNSGKKTHSFFHNLTETNIEEDPIRFFKDMILEALNQLEQSQKEIRYDSVSTFKKRIRVTLPWSGGEVGRVFNRNEMQHLLSQVNKEETISQALMVGQPATKIVLVLELENIPYYNQQRDGYFTDRLEDMVEIRRAGSIEAAIDLHLVKIVTAFPVP